jgi:hypothetical protein
MNQQEFRQGERETRRLCNEAQLQGKGIFLPLSLSPCLPLYLCLEKIHETQRLEVQP